MEESDAEKPDTDNPAQLNTKKSNTQKTITDLSNTHSFFPSAAPAADGLTDGFDKRAEIKEQIEYDCICQQHDRILYALIKPEGIRQTGAPTLRKAR